MVTLYSTRFNIQVLSIMPTDSVYAFCMDLKRDSNYFLKQNSLTGFYKWDGARLLHNKT